MSLAIKDVYACCSTLKDSTKAKERKVSKILKIVLEINAIDDRVT
jgi:hypothetical protein